MSTRESEAWAAMVAKVEAKSKAYAVSNAAYRKKHRQTDIPGLDDIRDEALAIAKLINEMPADVGLISWRLLFSHRLSNMRKLINASGEV